MLQLTRALAVKCSTLTTAASTSCIKRRKTSSIWKQASTLSRSLSSCAKRPRRSGKPIQVIKLKPCSDSETNSWPHSLPLGLITRQRGKHLPKQLLPMIRKQRARKMQLSRLLYSPIRLSPWSEVTLSVKSYITSPFQRSQNI